MNIKPIDKLHISKGGQSWNARQHFATDAGAKLRVDVKSDAYENQSFARISGFDPASFQWHVIATLTGDERKARASYGLSVLPEAEESRFKMDVNALVARAALILG